MDKKFKASNYYKNILIERGNWSQLPRNLIVMYNREEELSNFLDQLANKSIKYEASSPSEHQSQSEFQGLHKTSSRDIYTSQRGRFIYLDENGINYSNDEWLQYIYKTYWRIIIDHKETLLLADFDLIPRLALSSPGVVQSHSIKGCIKRFLDFIDDQNGKAKMVDELTDHIAVYGRYGATEYS